MSEHKTPPDAIYLQFYGDGLPDDGVPGDTINGDDVTWAGEQIFDHDVRYINAQKFRRTIDNARLVASMWSDPVHKLKRRALEAFALELERLTA